MLDVSPLEKTVCAQILGLGGLAWGRGHPHNSLKDEKGNLMLAFPELRPEDFRPWIDESEAARNENINYLVAIKRSIGMLRK